MEGSCCWIWHQYKMSSVMEQYVQDALAMFRHHGCSEDALVSKQRLADILNRQAAANALPAFSPQIIEEIWGQAETTSRGEATALTFSRIYAQAAAILHQRVDLIDGPGGLSRKEDALVAEQCRLIDLEADYQQGLIESYDRINSARKNIVAIQNKIKELRNNRQDFQRELDEMTACLHIHHQQGEREETVAVERAVVQSRLQAETETAGPSQDLGVIFKVAVGGVCLHLGLMNYHPAFLALLGYLLVLFWLFLGYYDQYFVKTIMVALVAACLLDIAGIALSLALGAGSSRLYTPETVWRWVTAGVVALELLLRGLLVAKLWPFREPKAGRQHFLLMGREVELHLRSGKASL